MGKIVQELFEESATRLHAIGEKYIDPFGDTFRYVKNGAVALTTGHLLQEPAEDTNYRSMVCQAATAIGGKDIYVTLGGTAVTVDQFKEGTLIIESGTGAGQKFRILSHDVQTSTTGTCKFTVDRGVKIATVATTTQISVRKNSYLGVVDFPITPTGAPVGVSLYAMTASYYGWIQSGGNATVLFDNTDNSAADASAIIPSATVAGSVKAALAADVAPVHIGWSKEMVSVDSTNGIVHLIID